MGTSSGKPRARRAKHDREVRVTAAGAPWAPPWTLLQPELDKVEQAGFGVTRIDVSADPAEAERLRVIVVPTVIIARGGEERRRLTGAVDSDDIIKAAARHQ